MPGLESVSKRLFPRRFFVVLALALLLVGVGLPVTKAQAEHPLRLTDYSSQSRIDLEIGGGRMKKPLPSSFIHYLLAFDINIYANTHLLLAAPFSGYKGVDGGDNFIRGNLLAGAAYFLPFVDWAGMGFALRFYLPTYQEPAAVADPRSRDVRRAILLHWHYRFQYALEDAFPIQPEIALRFRKWNAYLQLEGGYTWAPRVRKNPYFARKKNISVFNYAVGFGYNLFDIVELGASFTALADPDKNAANLGDLLALAYRRPRALHAFVFGPRFQYKWLVVRMEFNVPLEKRFRDMLQVYYVGALEVQFP